MLAVRELYYTSCRELQGRFLPLTADKTSYEDRVEEGASGWWADGLTEVVYKYSVRSRTYCDAG